MISSVERRLLTINRAELYDLPNFAGFDCNGEALYFGDKVIVEVEDKARKGNPAYAFCGIGKEGTVTKVKANMIVWVADVKFEGHPQSHGCIDYHLRRIAVSGIIDPANMALDIAEL